MKKRVLSLFLTFVLSFSMMPMSAFAEGTGAVAEQEAQSSGDTAYVSTTGEGGAGADRRPAGGGHDGKCGRTSGAADGY